MSLRILIPAGLIALLAGLITYLPAPLAVGWVEGRVDGLRLAGVSGTLLDGRAQQVITPNAVLDTVEWQVNPLALLIGSLRAAVRIDTDSGAVTADIRSGLFGGTQINNIQGAASLGWIANLAGYRFVPLSGGLRVEAARLSIEGREIRTADGRIELGNARWQLLNPPAPIGSYVAQVSSADGDITAEVVDSDGPIVVEGQAVLKPGGIYNLNARLRARTSADSRLKNLLGQLGKADAQGWHTIRERGRLQ